MTETYKIEKRSPSTRWYPIHNGLTLEQAMDSLRTIRVNYDIDLHDGYESSLSADGLELRTYEKADLIEFRIVQE